MGMSILRLSTAPKASFVYYITRESSIFLFISFSKDIVIHHIQLLPTWIDCHNNLQLPIATFHKVITSYFSFQPPLISIKNYIKCQCHLHSKSDYTHNVNFRLHRFGNTKSNDLAMCKIVHRYRIYAKLHGKYYTNSYTEISFIFHTWCLTAIIHSKT